MPRLQPTCTDQNNDGVINDADRRPFHDPSPKWIRATHPISITALRSGITLRHTWATGFHNVASSNGCLPEPFGLPQCRVTCILSPDHRLCRAQYYSDYFVEDASFLRMENITLVTP